jgi:hypothetical protein
MAIRFPALLCLIAAVVGSWGARAQSSGSDLMLGPVRLAGDEPSYLELGAGAFDLQGHPGTGTLAEGKVEFRYGKKLFYIGPAIGLLANTKWRSLRLRRLSDAARRSRRLSSPLLGMEQSTRATVRKLAERQKPSRRCLDQTARRST